MERNRLELTPFVTSGGRRESEARFPHRVYRQEKAKQPVRAVGLLTKIAICCAVLLAVLVAELLLLPDAENVLETVASGEGTDTGDALGKLHFVSTGSAVSVFSAAQRWSAPVKAADTPRIEDPPPLCLAAAEGESVSLPAAGEVREIGHDENYGDFVRVSHGDGLESVYYNLTDVRVEVGQPLLARDTLGKVPEDGEIFVSVLLEGAAQPPEDYIGSESWY